MHQTIQFYGLAADVRINDVTLVLLIRSSFDDTHPLESPISRSQDPSCTVVSDSTPTTTLVPHTCASSMAKSLHCAYLDLGFFFGTFVLVQLPCRHLSGPDFPTLALRVNTGGFRASSGLSLRQASPAGRFGVSYI